MSERSVFDSGAEYCELHLHDEQYRGSYELESGQLRQRVAFTKEMAAEAIKQLQSFVTDLQDE